MATPPKGRRSRDVRRGGERREASEVDAENAELPTTDSGEALIGPETTGRYIVIFKEEAVSDTALLQSTLSGAALRNVVSSADYDAGAISAQDLAEQETIHFSKLGISVLSSEEAVQTLA